MVVNIFIRLLLFFLKGGEETMVTVYVTLIIKGAKTYEQVPANLKPAVKAELEVMELDTNGKPLAA
ncbi:CD1375 family protein [Paenibacillus sp. GCM10027626]|uniref:CD1375 family protein n=1 Tax=Paenibacillus sp. GCM10027626 TaxID=3273411 RepID=UPI0036255984